MGHLQQPRPRWWRAAGPHRRQCGVCLGLVLVLVLVLALAGAAMGLGLPALGLGLGIVLGLSRRAAAMRFLSIEVLRPVPSVALIPLAMLVFGVRMRTYE